MAYQARLSATAQPGAVARFASPTFDELLDQIFGRYPDQEWATFARFGWRATDDGLVISLASLELPRHGDLNATVDHVAIQEPYSLRVAIGSETTPLAIGVIHSHPEGYRTTASVIDDDMDRYYADYFSQFAPERPYVSLIFAMRAGELCASGRVFWRGRWHSVARFLAPGRSITIDGTTHAPSTNRRSTGTVARLIAAFGSEAADRLTSACIAVVGASGTGSPAIEVLARAGVGHIIAIDPDAFEESNLERVHGSNCDDGRAATPKVDIARRHVESIAPTTKVTTIRGRIPQAQVVDALVHADVVLGCTDRQHSRLALSDLAVRYLVPVFDCGVALEGAAGHVTGQILQAIRFLPHDPCALCRELVDPIRIAQELMSANERATRQAAADDAIRRGEDPNPYWRNEPQLNTVGYLTTIAGALVAGYAIGMITTRFGSPFTRLQMNLSEPLLDVTDVDAAARGDCVCRRVRGWADQASADAMVTAPRHWPAPELSSDHRGVLDSIGVITG